MSKNKFCAAVTLSAVATALAVSVSGCSMVREYWQYFTGDLDTSLREPTGYYEHADTEDTVDLLVIPDGLDSPDFDRNMLIPENSYLSEGPVGEEMDIRPPIAPRRSDLGLHSQWNAGEAIVWFDALGNHGIYSEEAAWNLLGKMLKRLNIAPGDVSDDAFELTTVASDFNEYGMPYNAIDYGSKSLRYRQIYRMRIGRNDNGDLGIATSLIGSMTMLSSGYLIRDILNQIELERFAMGLSNQLIHELEMVANAQKHIPDVVHVSLGRDNNNQECMIVDAPYDSVWNALRSMLPSFNWEITEYSLSHGLLVLDVEEEDPEFYHARGVDSFAVEEDKYYIRVGVEGDRTVITFFDKDDKPLKAQIVDHIFSGFSQALINEFDEIRSSGDKIVL